jgi:hypothetical protein
MARHLALAVAALVAACAGRQQGPDAAPQAVTMPAPSVAPRSSAGRLPLGTRLGERNRCIDRELARRHLNEFGDPEGVGYADGRPLGVTETTDRYEYVMRKRRDIATACTRAPDEPER